MEPLSIDNLVAQATNVFIKNGYTKRSIHEKETIMQKIAYLHKQNGCDYYNPEIADQFLQDAESRYQRHEIGTTRFRFYQKTVDYLKQFNETGTLDLYSRNIPSGLTPYYENIISRIKDYPEWSESTKRYICQFGKTYFKWLIRNGINSLDHVNTDIVRKYLLNCTDRMTLNSVDTTKRVLKKLHVYLYESGFCKEDLSATFSFTVPTEHKIKRPVPQDEIAAVLNVIDRSSAIGRRDYAVILLAIVTGLRSIDIVNLELGSIDWINGEIRITQSKTEKTLTLPLTKDVGRAIQNYILNGRPESTLPYVFLQGRSPYAKMGRSIPYMIFNGYRQKIGLPKCPFHGLRRAVGTNMVIAGVPVTTIAQVLGHSDINSTKQYISLDSVHLKECALDLKGFMPEGGAER